MNWNAESYRKRFNLWLSQRDYENIVYLKQRKNASSMNSVIIKLINAYAQQLKDKDALELQKQNQSVE